MSFAALAIQEPSEVEIGMLVGTSAGTDPVTLDQIPVNVNIEAAITLPDSVTFRLVTPVEGISVEGSKITATKSNARFNLVITLTTDGFSFRDPAILWVNPPQQGYNTNPFGTEPLHPAPWLTSVTIPNMTGPKGSGSQSTPFALVLNGPDGHVTVIDPTIVDEPNT
jgi:hypothetical protein